MNLEGLTEKQVQTRKSQGKINTVSKKNGNTIGKIILKNTLTIFNFVNLVLAGMIISVGAYKNLFFIVVAIVNTLISIINAIRAKYTIDRMRLKSERQPTVIRNGKPIQIPQSEIVQDDLIVYALGDQIIVDSRIEQGTVEVNESFITGEQDNITKHQGDKLISGSFVVSGNCKAVATAVGEDNFINKLEQSAHKVKTADSKLFHLINDIVKYISFALIPIGILLLISRINVPNTTNEIAVTTTVAGLISMIPEGLVLLTSSVLALATIRLSRRKVLVQDLYSVETLARVDCIALDKTGTLTTGKMTVSEIIPAAGQNKKTLEDALKLILSTQDTDNATSTALKKKLLKTAKYEPKEQIQEIIPFSSERKYSGVATKKATYLMGAPEIITKEKVSFDGHFRVIAIIKAEPKPDLGSNTNILLGYVLLEDELRKDAKEIINYFYDNNVDVRIISGDNLNTVKTIAKNTGIRDISGIELSSLKGEINYEELVRNYNIFTRVKPAQKKSLILALKKQGKTVTMTGDGVNDILAMKEADCSIAIGEGSDAARRSAKLVLLNNDFAGVPKIIDEGRQSINNLERSATLFLSKNIYAAILAVLFILIPLEYPYAPLEMSLLNLACIGTPGVILALETNTARIKNRFTKNILQYSLPIGITVSLAMLALSVIASLNNFTRPELVSASLIVTFAIDFLLIYSIARPLNPLRAGLLSMIIGIIVVAFLFPFLRNFFDLTIPSLNTILIVVVLIAASYLVFFLIRAIVRHYTPSLLQKYPKLNL